MNQQTEIIDAIAKHLGITAADIEQDASLTEDLGLGAIEMADLLNYISEKYSITFDPTETEDIKTVNDLVVTVEDLLLE